jgi:phage FluMu protein Com
MEIIKHGDTYQEICCEHCNALFGYCGNDETSSSMTQLGGNSYIYVKTIKCPECGNVIILRKECIEL